MNFLAHTFLSGDMTDIIIGNFIGDFVKGNRYLKYPEEIRYGILLHRYIDSFTDSHPVVQQSKSRFAPFYHKYAGIIVDILYDHFLSANWDNISSVSLPEMTKRTYDILHEHYDLLPPGAQRIVPSFIFHRWLEAYHTTEGFELVLERMSQRTSLPEKTRDAMEVLKKHYYDFQAEFYEFFPEIVYYVTDSFDIKLPLAPSFNTKAG